MGSAVDGRVLRVVPPSWGLGAAIAMAALLALTTLSARPVLRARRRGRLRRGTVVVAAVSGAVLAMVVAATIVFLVLNRVELAEGVLAWSSPTRLDRRPGRRSAAPPRVAGRVRTHGRRPRAAAAGGLRSGAQPFTAPCVTPSITQRWVNR